MGLGCRYGLLSSIFTRRITFKAELARRRQIAPLISRERLMTLGDDEAV
jgi:hypothetical protein